MSIKQKITTYVIGLITLSVAIGNETNQTGLGFITLGLGLIALPFIFQYD